MFQINLIYERFIELAIAPYNYPDMLWIIIPLILAVVLTEIYFGRYKFEELGWNTAYGNSLVLLFVGMNLLSFLYKNDMIYPLTIQSIMTIVLLTEGVILILTNFFHFLPKNFSFSINSALPLNLVSYMIVVLVYSNILIDLATLLAALSLVVLLVILVKSIWFLVPETFEEEDSS